MGQEDRIRCLCGAHVGEVLVCPVRLNKKPGSWKPSPG